MMAVLTGLTLLAGVGCTKQIQGSAQPDPDAPLTQVSEDGYGLTAGFADAPVQIEIFAEPQCSHCADLQRDVGDGLRHYIGLGQLAVTYRPMTFLDTGDLGYSARVSNALFVAASQPDSPAVAFQAFVEALWADQDPSGRGPDDDEIADPTWLSALLATIGNSATGIRSSSAWTEISVSISNPTDSTGKLFTNRREKTR